MLNNRIISSKLSNLILVIFLSFSFVLANTSTLNFKTSSIRIFFMLCLFSIFYFLIFFSRQTLISTAVLSGVILIGSSGVGLYYKTITTPFKEAAACYYWLVDYVNGDAELIPKYEFYFTIFLCISVSLLVYTFTEYIYNFYILTAGGASIFVTQWILDFFVSYAAFYIFLIFILIYYLKYIYYGKLSNLGNEYAPPLTFTLWLVPFSALILSVSMSLPPKDAPITWQWLDNKITTFFNYINNNYQYKTYDYFSIASSGFGSDPNNLGGKVNLNKNIVLDVESPRRIYLKGASYDTYTGNSWESNDKTGLPYSDRNNKLAQDINDMNAGMPYLSGDRNFLEKFFYRDDISVLFRGLRTKSIFISSKTSSIKQEDRRMVNADVFSNGYVASDRFLEKGFKYSFQMFSPKYDDDDFKNSLRKSRKGILSTINASSINTFNYISRTQVFEWDSKKNRYIINTGSENRLRNNTSYQTLRQQLENANEAYDRFLQLPENLPKRVRDLSVSLTSSAANDYDKVKALEKYLSQKYPYTLSPKNTPKGKDFVDNFLFDLKQGYCVYYASSMAVMARSIGIPARYVEGYIMPSAKNSSNIYEVSNEQAHSWVEVYFEGFGWLPFEPTSPFVSGFYNDQTYVPTFTDEFLEDPEMQDYLDDLENLNNLGIYGLDNIGQYEDENNRKMFIIYMTSVSALFILLLSFVLVNLFRHRLRFFRYSKMGPNDSVLYLYKYYVMLLSLVKMGIAPGETAAMFAERVDNYMVFRPVRFKTVTETFILARYSTQTLDESEKQKVYEFHKQLLDKIKADLGTVRYFIYSYITGTI